MNSKERVFAAMSHSSCDRVPVMCQLSLGHYFLNCERKPYEIWFDPDAFAQSLVELQERYHFDGILVNLPGRPMDWRKYLVSHEKTGKIEKLAWDNGYITEVPGDDNPHTYLENHEALPRASFENLDLDNPNTFRVAGYIWNIYHVPQLWDIPEESDLSKVSTYPSYFTNTIKAVNKLAPDVSLHQEVFSPFSHFLEFFGYQEGLMGLLIYPELCRKILEKFTEIVIAQVRLFSKEQLDAILVSSPFAGAGFISREFYQEFVLPYEDAIFKEIKKNNLFAYVHTCGAIGDRLDLMARTSVDGIDTLDPPPLGTVQLDEAKQSYGKRFFLKGNLDSVNDLLNADDENYEKAVIERLETGKKGSGYILSTACSVAPYVKPERISKLVEFAKKYGTLK